MRFLPFSGKQGAHARWPLVFLALAFLAGRSSGDGLPWPIDAGRYVTSTFGEPRPGRFHLGMDFTSGGVTGKPVYALADGWISGISVSDGGYGKKLEFTLSDGRVLVYGHLSAFLPAIEDSLDVLRGTVFRRYEAGIAFPPGEFPFRRGDVLCWSGESGSGPPHLHVELREPDGTPLNLLDYGLAADDSVPPVIGDIVLIPLDRESLVDGSPLPWRWDPAAEPPHLSGRVGIAAVLTDRVVIGGARLGVYRVGLAVDSVEVFSKTYTRIRASGLPDGGMDYIPGDRCGVSGTLSAFFRRDDCPAGFYTGTGLPVIPDVAPSATHVIAITAEDHAGMAARKEIPVVYGARPEITVCGFSPEGGLRVSGYASSGELDRIEIAVSRPDGRAETRRVPVSGAACAISERIGLSGPVSCRAVLVAKSGVRSLPREVRFDPSASSGLPAGLSIAVELLHDCLAATVTSSGSLAMVPSFAFSRDGGPEEYALAVPAGERVWVARIPLGFTGDAVFRMTARALDPGLREVSASSPVRITIVSPSGEAFVYAPDTRFSISIPAGAVLRSAPVLVDTAGVFQPEGLRAVTPVYRIDWGDTPVPGPARVAFHLKKSPRDHALVFVSGDGRTWRPLETARKGRTVDAVFSGPGLAGVFEDTEDPEIAVTEPAPGSSAGARPVIRLAVNDRGSGIGGSEDIRLTIDGEPAYAEYDSERGIVRYEFRKDLASGKHRAAVEVTDRAGRKANMKWEFAVQ